MKRKEILTPYIGKKYNRLTILEISEPKIRPNGFYINTVICKCDCGTIKKFDLPHVKSGNSKSCGCFKIEKAKTNPTGTKHSFSKLDIYHVWDSMKRRCYNKNNKAYPSYGGRGIKMYKKWITNPAIFIRWSMKNGYKKGMILDRRNNNKGYTPSNCRFITMAESNRNKRSNIIINYNNISKTFKEWSRELNFKYTSGLYLLKTGRTFEEIIKTLCK